jgi:GNAT superfamily N-acetyltransferase
VEWIKFRPDHLEVKLAGGPSINLRRSEVGSKVPAEQWNAIVDPDHRGQRLGLVVKIANLRLLRREIAGALRLETWNANENTRMIAINELLGFQIVERVDQFQLAL